MAALIPVQIHPRAAEESNMPDTILLLPLPDNASH
jgi:hypothetical protein